MSIPHKKHTIIKLKKVGREYFWEKSTYILESKKIVRRAQWLDIMIHFMSGKTEY